MADTFPDELPKPVIAHVLFTDVVGYSRLTTDQQTETLHELQRVIRGSTEFSRAQANDELIRNPTGDGVALVFFNDPLAPAKCALEIADGISKGSPLKLRMGVHSGPVYRITDINGKENVAGGGINMAQRVMDCGDAGHILVSETVAKTLNEFDGWAERLHDLGEAQVKHGVTVHIFNLCTPELGNATPPARVAEAPKQSPAAAAPPDATPRVEPAAKLRIAIIYKRNAQPDEDVLKFLESELSARGYKVFIDRHLKIGLEWAKEIEHVVRTADAVIPLISPAAMNSEMLACELQIADDASQKHGGKPRLLPVRLNYEGPLPTALGNILDRYQYALWRNPQDNPALVSELIAALERPPEAALRSSRLEAPGGAVPLDSAFYVVRPTDHEFLAAISRRDSIVLVKGARQMGKTSALSRGLQQARKSGGRVVFTDLQKLNAADLETIEKFYVTLGATIADQLDLDVFPEDVWKPKRGPNENFERYLRREILAKLDAPLVWGLDEVDRLFTCPFGNEVFGLFRSWHNARALDPQSPWEKLTLAIAYATEAHLFITDLNQSPFNVGTRLMLQDFTIENVADLNSRYGSPLKDNAQVQAFFDLVGGQPYLVRRGLHDMVTRNLRIEDFQEKAASDEGSFGDHLRRFLVLVSQDAKLVAALRALLSKPPVAPDAQTFHRLRSAGLLAGEVAEEARFRCRIYEVYLARHLKP